VASDGGYIEQLLVADGHLVYSDRHNNVGWVKTDGSDCGLVVAQFVPRGKGRTVGLTIDASYLYLLDSTEGTIVRVARSALGF
jgi:hypothetical protein